jgi:solute carrier family 39 (zinc transporter), member 1/2/3
VLKQFGTGIIISTAFVHLYTHASLMFTNQCLRSNVQYEATTSAIVMAGILLSFLVDYVSHRLAARYYSPGSGSSQTGHDDLVNVMVLEAGIIFHSILIGLTLVVAGDSFFITLFIVILFHQMFEGLALGTRIACLGRPSSTATSTSTSSSTPTTTTIVETPEAAMTHDAKTDSPATVPPAPSNAEALQDKSTTTSTTAASTTTKGTTLSLAKKLLMALAFAVTSPIGMAIGIGVLHRFNGNDPATIVAIGTLDALSAGILIWVGMIDMLARDWIGRDAELAHTGLATTALAGTGLVAGLVLMSVLGKWA